jgi:sigma-E factor negative regulatory protein RseA
MTHSPSTDRADAMPYEPRQWLSALADGRSDALPPGTALWRDDADARQAWHLYHLIGDVMRSDELASAPARDAAFMATLRTRLAAEPVPLAPQPLQTPVARRLGWRAPAAVAAGFVAVAAMVVLMAPQRDRPGAGPQLAANSPVGEGNSTRPVSTTRPAVPPVLVDQGSVIRDARIETYLRAHQGVRVGSPALSGGALRNAEHVAPALTPTAKPVMRPASESR